MDLDFLEFSPFPHASRDVSRSDLAQPAQDSLVWHSKVNPVESRIVLLEVYRDWNCGVGGVWYDYFRKNSMTEDRRRTDGCRRYDEE